MTVPLIVADAAPFTAPLALVETVWSVSTYRPADPRLGSKLLSRVEACVVSKPPTSARTSPPTCEPRASLIVAAPYPSAVASLATVPVMSTRAAPLTAVPVALDARWAEV